MKAMRYRIYAGSVWYFQAETIELITEKWDELVLLCQNEVFVVNGKTMKVEDLRLLDLEEGKQIMP